MRAYVTLLSNRRYLEGVLALNQCLKDVESSYPLYCLLSGSVDKELEDTLVKHGIQCVRYKGENLNGNANGPGACYAHWSFTFDKLHVWGLTQFEKIVFLDSDMIILRNLDHLFDKPAFSAAVAGAGLFGWTKLNSGLMVIEPDKKVEEELIDLAPSVIDDFRKKNISVGDQDVIQAYCPWWETRGELLLDEGYNMVADWLDTYIRKFGYSLTGKKGKPINVVHFIGHTKPWTPKTMREKIWVLKTSIRNPYFLRCYLKFYRFLKKAKKSV